MIEKTKAKKSIAGTVHDEMPLTDMFPNSKFDVINSPGIWVSTWDEIPKICRVGSSSKDVHAKDNEIIVYYYVEENHHKDVESVQANCKIYTEKSGSLIYEKNINLKKNQWHYDHLYIYEDVVVQLKTDRGFEKTLKLSPASIRDLYPRYVINDTKK